MQTSNFLSSSKQRRFRLHFGYISGQSPVGQNVETADSNNGAGGSNNDEGENDDEGEGSEEGEGEDADEPGDVDSNDEEDQTRKRNPFLLKTKKNKLQCPTPTFFLSGPITVGFVLFSQIWNIPYK